MAIGGVVANAWFIYIAADAVNEARWAHWSLARYPMAFGREIDPATIASLQDHHFLWTSATALVITCVFGLLLAVHLLRSTRQIDRAPELAVRRLTRYRRIKPFAVAATASSFFCCALADHAFWVAATRHISTGDITPFSEMLEAALLAICGLIPWWWIRKQTL